jgi:hypothetical protein
LKIYYESHFLNYNRYLPDFLLGDEFDGVIPTISSRVSTVDAFEDPLPALFRFFFDPPDECCGEFEADEVIVVAAGVVSTYFFIPLRPRSREKALEYDNSSNGSAAAGVTAKVGDFGAFFPLAPLKLLMMAW